MATVNAGFFARSVKQLDVAAGKASMSVDYSNARIKEKHGGLELATTNGLMLALAIVEGKDVPAGLSAIVPYNKLLAASKKHKKDALLEIGVAEQCLVLQSRDRQSPIPLTLDGFQPYEGVIESLQVVGSGKVRKSHLDEACKFLSAGLKVTMAFDPKNGLIRLSTATPVKEMEAETSVPVRCATGSAIEVIVFGRYLARISKNCTEDELEIAFSGEDSLVSIKDENMKYYFQPFGKKEE